MPSKTPRLRARADDAPLTKRELATARPLRDEFPELAAYSRSRAKKGEPTKKAVSIRLSPEVLAFYKAKGSGWQTRIDDTLKALVEAVR
ncbi:MAG: BrnA antitoxin family protein [Bdellovibrionales bacterium]|jgi:uncharacterized protein (DUF4415 family)